MIELIGKPVHYDEKIHIHQHLIRDGLYRVRAVIDMPKYGVKAGDLGGLCDKSADIRDCFWIDEKSSVYGKSSLDRSVIRNSRVTDSNVDLSIVENESDITNSTVFRCYISDAYIRDNIYAMGSAVVSSSISGHSRIYSSFIKNSSVGLSSYTPPVHDAELLSSAHFLSVAGLGSENVTSIVYRTSSGHSISVGCWVNTYREAEELPSRRSTLDDLAKAVDDREESDWVYMDGYTKEEGQFWRDQYALFEQLARLTIKDWHNV